MRALIIIAIFIAVFSQRVKIKAYLFTLKFPSLVEISLMPILEGMYYVVGTLAAILGMIWIIIQIRRSKRNPESKATPSDRADMATQTRWMFGLMITMTIAIIVAVLL